MPDWKQKTAIAATATVALIVFLAVVIDHNREPVFDERLRTWETPVIFGYDPNMVEFAGDLADAIDDLNKAVGCPLASIDSERAQVRVIWLGANRCGEASASTPEADAAYYQCDTGGGYIEMRRIFTHLHARIMFRHETGHVFGLAHDDSGHSVMRTPPEYEAVPAPTWTPKDIEALKMRYGCP